MIGLMETGATCIYINSTIWKMLRYLGQLDKTTCRVASGSLCHSIATVTCPISLEHRMVVQEFLVIPSLLEPCILGIDFLKTLGIFLDKAWIARELRHLDATPTICELVETDHAVVSRDHLSFEQRHQLNSLLDEQFVQVVKGFLATDRTRSVLCSNSERIKQRYYLANPVIQLQIDEKLDKLLEMGIVESSKSPWASPIILVKRKDEKRRFVVDFRKVNAVCEKDGYPTLR